MARFLLDANLSPKVGRFLANELNLDVVTLHGLGPGNLPDHQVIHMARLHNRMIITLDRDFAEYFYRTEHPAIGVIYLNLPITHRFIPAINPVLRDFFLAHADEIELENCLVTIGDKKVQIMHADAEAE